MKTLHVAPSDTGAGCIRQAIRDAGLDHEVLSCCDNLSCGPINSDSPAVRATWWSQFCEDLTFEASVEKFWKRVATADERLVVWFSRHSASEFSFLHALMDRLTDRSHEHIDVADLHFPYRDGCGASGSVQSVGEMNPDMVRSLLGTEKESTPEQRAKAILAWHQLKEENAPFRIITDTGLTSASIDYFDPWLLRRSATEWKPVARVIGETMVYADEPYIQVGDIMLSARVVELVNTGKLLADGDPREALTCRVRLPG